MNKQIRLAVPEDTGALLGIYAPYVTDTAVTLEYTVPSEEDFRVRIQAVLEQFPWLVCEADGKIAGYAYASPFQKRAAYQWDAELSVYVSPLPNPASIGFHQSYGFETAGVYHGTGFKFNKWHDMTVLEKRLRDFSYNETPQKPVPYPQLKQAGIF